MVPLLVRRVIAVLLLAVLAVGGGGMPTVDALIFHRSTEHAAGYRPHFEARSSCHADGCAVRSQTHESRFVLAPGVGSLRSAAPESRIEARATRIVPSTPDPTSHLSRAPPLSI